MKIDFSGQVAIVTGAGGGIGRAVSLALSDVGAKVLLVDLSQASGLETEALITQRGGSALFVSADVSQQQNVEAYVKVAMDTWGRIDVFMNNAAWQGEISSIVNYPVEMFDKVMGINVRGVFLGLKAVLPIMIKQGKGVVINTASLGAYIGTRNLGPYTASKHAVLGLTKTAALEVARKGIRINAVCPGPVDTEMLRQIELDQSKDSAAALSLREQRAASIPDGRYADPSEVANLMLYLASDYASHITGQGVQINGGSHA
jgi:NAD(P)-dependent dehydrogenase (short-subunit alcohol dehydrogenase family)